MFKKICPKCFLPAPTSSINENDVMNSLSHDGKTYICSQCGQIESMGGIYGEAAVYGQILGQRRAQAALYGLIKGEPNVPRVKLEKGQSLWYDFENKQVKIKNASKKKSS